MRYPTTLANGFAEPTLAQAIYAMLRAGYHVTVRSVVNATGYSTSAARKDLQYMVREGVAQRGIAPDGSVYAYSMRHRPAGQ